MDLAPDTSAHDTIRQSVIILMGSLARHLDKDDPKVREVVLCSSNQLSRLSVFIVCLFVCLFVCLCLRVAFWVTDGQTYEFIIILTRFSFSSRFAP